MAPAMNLPIEAYDMEDDEYQKGVKHLCERGLTKVPNRFILPISDRPGTSNRDGVEDIWLPIIDFFQLQGPNRAQALNSLSKACQEYGFFQLINHGISSDSAKNIVNVGKEFFELPYEERSKYMSKDMKAPVRYGTSFNQNKDVVFCWRDLLKVNCRSDDVLSFLPSSPPQLREIVSNYSKETTVLYLMLVEAILESLGLIKGVDQNHNDQDKLVKEFEDGSQMIVFNYYPACPEPELTLGLKPHSDYGFLTLLLQDEVKGLQIQHQGRWVNVKPIPNSFVVNVGDHLEIFSNGKYKSVLHRVLVNSTKSRVSVASLHSLCFDRMIRPSPELINEANPRRYKDTDFASFIEFISSCQHVGKNFLDSRKLTH